MAARDFSNNPSGTNLDSVQGTSRVVAFFQRRDDAYRALTSIKEAGFDTDAIGLAGGPDGAATSSQQTGPRDESFWQKVKDFFSGESADESDHDDNFRDATGNMGWNEDRYGYYEKGISSGGAVVTVTGERIDEAKRILESCGGDLRERGFATTGSDDQQGAERVSALNNTVSPGTEVEGEQRIQLRGEMLRTYKDRVQRGEVRLRKEVVTENHTMNVPVTREELVIERTEGGGTPVGEIGSGENEIRVPLSEERVRLEKQPVVTEEVRVGKRKVKSDQQVGDRVRHEELRVEKEGDVNAETATPPKKRQNPAA